jgi:hypothetical protein
MADKQTNDIAITARGPFGQALVRFMTTNDIPSSWSGIEETRGISAMLSGAWFNNELNLLDPGDSDRGFDINPEMMIHLCPVGRDSESFNLATIVALAAAFCKQQLALAESVLGKPKKRRSTKSK